MARPVVAKLLEYTDRAESAKYARLSLSSQKERGVMPPFLNSIRVPTLQCSALYLAEARDKTAYRSLESETTRAKQRLLQHSIEAKRSEEEFYRSEYCSPAKLQPAWDKMLSDYGGQLESSFPEGVPAELETAVEKIQGMVPFIVSSCTAVSAGKYASLLVKRQRKMDVKKDTDVTMGSTEVDQKTLEAAVQSVMKRRNQSQKDKRIARKGKGTTHLIQSTGNWNHHTKTPTSRPQARQEGRKTTTQDEVRFILSRRGPNFKVGRWSTYPRVYFSAHWKARLLFQQVCSTGSFLNGLKILAEEVHKGDGVMLPRNIESFLALNLKFVFPQKPNLDLPIDAFDDLINSLRRKIYFQGVERIQSAFPPERTGAVFDQQEPKFEAGVRLGREALVRELSSVPFSNNPRRAGVFSLEGYHVRPGQLRRFMRENELLAFISDKNLGITCVTKDWYSDQCKAFLQNQIFKRVRQEDLPFQEINLHCMDASQRPQFPPDIQRHLFGYDKTCQIPVFHGIPKIHKTPWKLRPIVPMHSFATARLAQVVDHYLKSVIERLPTVITSSRQFVKRILTVNAGLRKGWKMGTGDVTAMYTNIPSKALANAVYGVLRAYSDLDSSLIELLCSEIEFLNDHVFFQFEGLCFQQLQGIAMGLHCGPALANIFMASWEEWGVRGEDFLFYGRYIDDTFFISPADSDAHHRITAPGMEIVWHLSSTLPFLDVEVFRTGEGTVGTRPFFKAKNAYQYLPWSSGHPLSVKKSLVKTELLRYRSSSSQRRHFVEARRLLVQRLRSRGYPNRVLNAWIKQVSWTHPLGVPAVGRRGTESFKELARSEYNPVWNYISLHPAWHIMTAEWDRLGFSDRPFHDGVVKSQSRTSNLWDLVRKVNKVHFREKIVFEEGSSSEDTEILEGVREYDFLVPGRAKLDADGHASFEKIN